MSFDLSSNSAAELAESVLAPLILPEIGPPPRPTLPCGASGYDAFVTLTLAEAAYVGRAATAFLNGRDPEATRRLRVGLRRSRCVLKLFKPTLDPTFAARTSLAAQRVGRVLGPLRSLEVMSRETAPAQRRAAVAERAAGLAPPEVPRAFERLETLLSRRCAAAAAQARQGTLALDLGRALIDLSGDLRSDGWASSDRKRRQALAKPARRAAGPALERALRKVAVWGARLPTLTIDERHEMRKAAKTLRYAVEFFGGLYDEDEVKRYRRALKRLQARFGALNDAAEVEMLRHAPIQADGAPVDARSDPALANAIETAIVRAEALMRAEFPKAQTAWTELSATPLFWR